MSIVAIGAMAACAGPVAFASAPVSTPARRDSLQCADQFLSERGYERSGTASEALATFTLKRAERGRVVPVARESTLSVTVESRGGMLMAQGTHDRQVQSDIRALAAACGSQSTASADPEGYTTISGRALPGALECVLNRMPARHQLVGGGLESRYLRYFTPGVGAAGEPSATISVADGMIRAVVDDDVLEDVRAVLRQCG